MYYNVVTWLSQCNNKVVNKIVTTLYELVFSVWEVTKKYKYLSERRKKKIIQSNSPVKYSIPVVHSTVSNHNNHNHNLIIWYI